MQKSVSERNFLADQFDSAAAQTNSMNEYLRKMHRIAKERFERDRTKCYQRHIREVWAQAQPREQVTSLDGAVVERITREEAESIILKYEWLAADPRNNAPMGRGIQAFYGLRLNGELIGANCLGKMGGDISNVCGKANAKKAVCLHRGCLLYTSDAADEED